MMETKTKQVAQAMIDALSNASEMNDIIDGVDRDPIMSGAAATFEMYKDVLVPGPRSPRVRQIVHHRIVYRITVEASVMPMEGMDEENGV